MNTACIRRKVCIIEIYSTPMPKSSIKTSVNISTKYFVLFCYFRVKRVGGYILISFIIIKKDMSNATMRQLSTRRLQNKNKNCNLTIQKRNMKTGLCIKSKPWGVAQFICLCGFCRAYDLCRSNLDTGIVIWRRRRC